MKNLSMTRAAERPSVWSDRVARGLITASAMVAIVSLVLIFIFIGKEALVNAGEAKRERIGLVLTDRGIAREGSNVYHGGKLIGVTTSGTLLPFTNKASAMALVTKGVVHTEDEVEVDVRGRMLKAKVVALPFYKRS